MSFHIGKKPLGQQDCAFFPGNVWDEDFWMVLYKTRMIEQLRKFQITYLYKPTKRNSSLFIKVVQNRNNAITAIKTICILKIITMANYFQHMRTQYSYPIKKLRVEFNRSFQFFQRKLFTVDSFIRYVWGFHVNLHF